MADIALALLALIFIIVMIRRLVEHRREKQCLAGELEAARAVQQLLLPDTAQNKSTLWADARICRDRRARPGFGNCHSP